MYFEPIHEKTRVIKYVHQTMSFPPNIVCAFIERDDKAFFETYNYESNELIKSGYVLLGEYWFLVCRFHYWKNKVIII